MKESNGPVAVVGEGFIEPKADIKATIAAAAAAAAADAVRAIDTAKVAQKLGRVKELPF